MTVEFRNFEYSYVGPKGKPVFVPSSDGRTVGVQIKKIVAAKVEFAPIFYHLGKGGHVAALHAHRKNRLLAKIDLKDFYYSIARNRVGRALHEIGVGGPKHFARWSSVKNPMKSPSYSLPYGFVQSPILATLVLQQSALGKLAISLSKSIALSIYVDDIAISGNNEQELDAALNALINSAKDSKFEVNQRKVSGPALASTLFNCEVEYGRTEVTATRREEFYSTSHSPESVEAFEKYCHDVSGE